MSPIECTLIDVLATKGPIRGTAQVGYSLWPDRSMQPQGAAVAAGKVIRGLLDKKYIVSIEDNKLSRYEATQAGRDALEQHRLAAVDTRQLSILD